MLKNLWKTHLAQYHSNVTDEEDDYVTLLRLEDDMTFYRDLTHAQRSVLGIKTRQHIMQHNRIALGTRWIIDVAHDDSAMYQSLYLLLGLRTCETHRIKRISKQLVKAYFIKAGGLLSTLIDLLVYDEVALYKESQPVTRALLMKKLIHGQ